MTDIPDEVVEKVDLAIKRASYLGKDKAYSAIRAYRKAMRERGVVEIPLKWIDDTESHLTDEAVKRYPHDVLRRGVIPNFAALRKHLATVEGK